MNKILTGGSLFSSSDQPFSFARRGTADALSRCNINETPRPGEDARIFFISPSLLFFLSFDDTEKEIIPTQVEMHRAFLLFRSQGFALS